MAMSPNSISVQFNHVWQIFSEGEPDEFVALQDIHFEINRGEFVCIIGPSGCGKSTLLNLVAHTLRPTQGSVYYEGQEITQINQRVGYITQEDNLLPWRTLHDNVGIALEIRKVNPQERRQRVQEMLQRVGLEGFGHRYPSQLSGGMRKRASLARTLIYHPDTLLMDEPFGALDAQMRVVMQRDLLSLWERDRKTVLFVTHDLEESITLADKIVVFGTHPGRVVHVEPVPFRRPRDIMELRDQHQFHEIWRRLWSLIESQIEPDRHRSRAGHSLGGGERP